MVRAIRRRRRPRRPMRSPIDRRTSAGIETLSCAISVRNVATGQRVVRDRATPIARRARPCTMANTGGSIASVASVAAARPPITARPSGAVCFGARANRERHRQHAGDHRQARHQNRPQTAAPRRHRGRVRGLAAALAAHCSANVTSRIAFATATPIAMIAPMNDCTFSVVPVMSSATMTPHEHRRHGGEHDERELERLEVRRQAAERSRATAAASPTARLRSVSRIGAIWPRTVTVYAAAADRPRA